MQWLVGSKQTIKPRPTAYLDGIRGVAALCVVIHHYTCQFTPALLRGYGSSDEDFYFLQLPIVSAIHNGAFMVNLFYVLSGCVLSTRCLKLAREGKQAKFTAALVSSVCRRWIRLFLPVIVTMAIAASISRAGLWHRDSAKPSVPISSSTYYRGPQPPSALPCVNVPRHDNINSANKTQVETIAVAETKKRERPRWVSAWKMQPRMASFSEQFWHFEETIEVVVDPFNMGGREGDITQLMDPYNPGDVLWTIPLEWTGSMLVFMLMLMTAWIIKSYVRLATYVFLVAWCIHTLRWYQARFISGMIISELMLNIEDQRQLAMTMEDVEKLELRTFEPGKCWNFKSAGCMILLVMSLFLGSLPHTDPGEALGFRALLAHSPRWYGQGVSHIFLAIGSFLFMISVTYSAALQNMFNTSVARYLGKISFALYLIHVLVLWTAGTRIFEICINMLGKEKYPYMVAITTGTCIVLPLTIWLASLYTIYVDEKCVALAKWVGDKLLFSFD